MNVVILLGRLTRDPVLKYSERGTPVVSFGVATNRGKEEKRETYFGECVAFGPLAEWIAEMTKGSGIFIKGRLITRKVEGKDRPTTRVIVETARRVDFPSPADAERDDLLEEALRETDLLDIDSEQEEENV